MYQMGVSFYENPTQGIPFRGRESKNIQQQGFAGGHPPNYESADLELMFGRADGMPSIS